MEREGFHGEAGAERHRHAVAGRLRRHAGCGPARRSAWPTTCCRSRAARRARSAAHPAAAPAPCCTASRIERPPACTAHSAMSFDGAVAAAAIAPCSRSQRRMRPGTWPDRCISKPWSPICQVISSALRGMTVGVEAIQRKPGRFGGNQAGTAAVAEQQEAQHLLELPLFLQMQAGKFQVDHQHLGVRFRADDVARQLQRVHRGEAAHEADDGAFDRSAQAGLRA